LELGCWSFLAEAFIEEPEFGVSPSHLINLHSVRLVIIEIINTGSELMLGRVLNTHQQWLCRELADLGWIVARQTSVPDTGADILQAVREALGRADLIITTGGLGPTSDDLTREMISQLLGRNLREDSNVLAQIESFFQTRNRPMPERTRVQALIPEGATVLPNAYGTAPGLALHVQPNLFRNGPTWLIMLPGPPRELRPMFREQVTPLLRRVSPADQDFVSLTLRTTGIGESFVQEKIAGGLSPLIEAGLDLGYCARPGQVDVRVAARGGNAQKLVSNAEQIVREQLGAYIFTCDDEELESVIIRLLTNRRQTLAVAESCTGGAIAHRLTNVPGAFAVFLAGLVTYSNESKQQFLGVQPDTLSRHGAVSEPVAREMAEGVRQRVQTDYALSVTGIAGPTGGTPAKPVGMVFIGLAGPSGTVVESFRNPYDRETFKQVTAQQSLELLRQTYLRTR
jgi:nicotinamide-nucleotide amidase